MQRRWVLLGAMAGLAACGGRLNPFNWFRRREPRVEEEVFALPADTRGLIDRVTDLALEETRSGLILRVTGLAGMQGYHDAELVGLPVDEEGLKVFEFRVAPPLAPTGPGPEASRTITAATAISFYQLDRISAIRVVAAQNALVARP